MREVSEEKQGGVEEEEEGKRKDVLSRGKTLLPGRVRLDAIVLRLTITSRHGIIISTTALKSPHTTKKGKRELTGEPIFVKILNTSPFMIAIPSGSVVSTCAGVFAQSVWLVR